MSQSLNPFIRGYQNLHVVCTLLITYEDDCPPAWRPLHASQAHLPDDEVARFPCIFCSNFALITEGQDIPAELEAQCPSDGLVRTVVYAVAGDDFGQPVHVGDAYSEKAAREMVRRLSFETVFYSRCWEISAEHLTDEAYRYLAGLAELDTPSSFLFIAFHIPYRRAVGVQLIGTPWTDDHLQPLEGISAEDLQQEHHDKGMPESLVEVLHLAGQADVRMLILDDDAAVLDGLPLYEA